MERVLTARFGVEGARSLDVARSHGAYLSLDKLKRLSPEATTALVAESGLRGRGGEGFPVGEKWGMVERDPKRPAYLIVNADESEPGAFKDRALLERDPHLVIEGMSIAAHAIGARSAFVYFRGERSGPMRAFEAALEEARSSKSLRGILDDAIVHRGAGAYICGEETALIKSIEGRRGEPSAKPPYPVTDGLYGMPTAVHNVETLANLPFIVREGPKAFRALGTGPSSGTKLVCVSGAVARPGVYEVEMGTPVSVVLADEASGMEEGKSLKALIPGGISTAVLTASEALSCTVDFESFAEAGSALGSGAMIAVDERTSMVKLLSDIAGFFARESCGRCAPCREGSGWISKILSRMEAGEGRRGDVFLLNDLALGMSQTSLCPMAQSLAIPVVSFLAKYRREFEAASGEA